MADVAMCDNCGELLRRTEMVLVQGKNPKAKQTQESFERGGRQMEVCRPCVDRVKSDGNLDLLDGQPDA